MIYELTILIFNNTNNNESILTRGVFLNSFLRVAFTLSLIFRNSGNFPQLGNEITPRPELPEFPKILPEKSAASTNPSNPPKVRILPCYAYYTQTAAGYGHCPIMFYPPTSPSAEKKASGETHTSETAHTSK